MSRVVPAALKKHTKSKAHRRKQGHPCDEVACAVFRNGKSRGAPFSRSSPSDLDVSRRSSTCGPLTWNTWVDTADAGMHSTETNKYGLSGHGPFTTERRSPSAWPPFRGQFPQCAWAEERWSARAFGPMEEVRLDQDPAWLRGQRWRMHARER